MRKLLAFSLVALTLNASAADLLTVYQDALQNSPLPKIYLATANATKEGTPIAAGALLPQVALTADGTYTRTVTGPYHYAYPNADYTLSVTQPLFNYTNYATLAGASDSSSAAEATYQSNMQNFILTVATDYFNVLLAQDNVDFAQAEIDSYKSTLDQTKAKFSVGLATYTDVAQARANYDSAQATLVSNQNALDNANQNLVELTGKPETNLAVVTQDFPFLPPTPADLDFWTEHAIQNNQALNAQRYTTKAALATVNEDVGNQLPTVDLDLSYGQTFYQHDVLSTVSAYPQVSQASIALSLTWNILSGGEQMGTTLQDANTYASSQNKELDLYRQTVANTKQDYLSVLANIAQVVAYKESVISAETSLKDYKAKYRVGTATIVDVLNATQTLYQAQSNLANAGYQYITSLLQLNYDAGTLSKQNLIALNQYLKVTQ